jgi:hypothetical protein
VLKVKRTLKALDFGMKIKDVLGIIIIYGSEMGAIGEVEFI